MLKKWLSMRGLSLDYEVGVIEKSRAVSGVEIVLCGVDGIREKDIICFWYFMFL